MKSISAKAASDLTKRFISKNNKYPRTELDNIVELISIAIRKGLYYIEVDGKLERDTIAILIGQGYLVTTDMVGRKTFNIITWCK